MVRTTKIHLTAAVLAISLILAPVSYAQADDGDDAIARGDYAGAFHYYEPLANRGDAHAQAQLGMLYLRKEGGPADDEKGLSWLRKAAQQGSPQAEVLLGFLHMAGKGVTQDNFQAAAWLRKASDHGDAMAAIALSDLYLSGRGVPKDPLQAVELLRKAADNGSAQAKVKLGQLYALGIGVSRDEAKAKILLHDAGLSDFHVTMYLMATRAVIPGQKPDNTDNLGASSDSKIKYSSYQDLVIAMKNNTIKNMWANTMNRDMGSIIYVTGHFVDGRPFFANLPNDPSIREALKRAGAKMMN